MTSATIAHAPSSTSTNTIAEKRPPMRDTREGYGIENNKSNSKSRYQVVARYRVAIKAGQSKLQYLFPERDKPMAFPSSLGILDRKCPG